MNAATPDPANDGAPETSGPRAKVYAPPAMAIRSAPPKAHGLPSRKFLLTGALILGGLVAFALTTGLSPQKRKQAEGRENALYRAATPPEQLREGPADYSEVDLSQAPAEGADQFARPQEVDYADQGVGGRGAPPAGLYGGSPTPPRYSAEQADDDAADARVSPILFGSKAAGLARGSGRDAMASSSRLTAPESHFILQAGSVVPAALRTALNSDAPGRVVAQVIANVYDSLSGDYLLIPQGARLLGTYDDGVRYGDRRIRVVWNRLILPNGYSLDLQEMAATDAAGAAGLSARVDDHVDRIAAMSVISGALSTAANAAQDRGSSIFAQSVGDAAAQEAARVGGRVVDRELDVRPTLRVPAGAKVKVLIERDLILRSGA